MIKAKRTVFAGLLAAGVLVAPGVAFAEFNAEPYYANDKECRDTSLVRDALLTVADAIDKGVYLGMKATTDESNLQTKLVAANAKTMQDKYGDAIDKLMDISNTATALASARKPKLESATAINNAVTAAIACLTR